MKILVCGATGFVGRDLVPSLLQQHQVVVLGRDSSKAKKIFNDTVSYATWDELAQLSPDEFDAVINLAGENIASNRWSENSKTKIKQSRIDSTQKIVAWCLNAKNKKPHIYNASAIGIYGLQNSENNFPERLTEATRISFGHPTDFLSDVGQSWEGALQDAINAGFPVTIMRFAVILKRHEGVLKKLAIPFNFGMGTILGNGKQPFTWIDIDDLIHAIHFLLEHPDITGPLNLCAPHCVSQKEFAKALASIMKRPLFLTMPAPIVKILFGQMGDELLLRGQNVYPERLLQLGFKFMYPELREALQHEWTRTVSEAKNG